MSSEEFALGGTGFGRAYDPSEIFDSRGMAGSIELRHRVPSSDRYLGRIWGYAFYDNGVVWRTEGDRDTLASAGFGIRMFPFDGVTASVEYAKPLTREISEESNKHGRIFFSLSSAF